jgi:hypothetical protein
LRVCMDFRFLKSLQLNGASGVHPFANYVGTFAGIFTSEIREVICLGTGF